MDYWRYKVERILEDGEFHMLVAQVFHSVNIRKSPWRICYRNEKGQWRVVPGLRSKEFQDKDEAQQFLDDWADENDHLIYIPEWEAEERWKI